MEDALGRKKGAIEAPVDREDLDKLIVLVKEYSEKLRSICEARMAARTRFLQIVLALATIFPGIIFASGYYALSFSSPRDNVFLFIPVALVLSALVTFLTPFRSQFRTLYDAERIAAIVERLIRTASQYSEHSAKRVSDRFELDLRIAEAEGALSLYRKVFRTDGDWKSKS